MASAVATTRRGSLAWAVLALSAVFFLVPIVWLLLKPFDVGTDLHLVGELNALLGRGRSHRRGPRDPGRLRARHDRIHWSAGAADRDDDRDADPEQRSRSTSVSRGQRGPHARQSARGDLAVRPVPVRRLHRLPVLQHPATFTDSSPPHASTAAPSGRHSAASCCPSLRRSSG